jgi:glycosyltransferase involved in cell wall biosynthesis
MSVKVVSDGRWTSTLTGDYAIGASTCAGCDVLRVHLNPDRHLLGDPYTQMGSALLEALGAVLDAEQPDLVHCGGFKAALVRLCRERGIPCVVTAHHPGFLCPAGSLLTDKGELCRVPAADAACIPCCTRQKVGSSFLGALLGGLPRSIAAAIGRGVARRQAAPYLLRGLALPWYVHTSLLRVRSVLENAPLIISPSHVMASYLTLNGVAAGRNIVVPHGIAPLGPVPADTRPDVIRFGYLGGFAALKGFHILVQALQMLPALPACELHVFGEANHPWERRYFDETVARYAGPHPIVKHAPVGQDSLGEAFSFVDALVVPSVLLEVFGLVVLEAQSAGRPVIASRCGGPEETIRDGVDGLLVRRGDPESLAEAMAALAQDPARRADMAARIRPVRTMREHVESLLGVYRELMERKA